MANSDLVWMFTPGYAYERVSDGDIFIGKTVSDAARAASNYADRNLHGISPEKIDEFKNSLNEFVASAEKGENSSWEHMLNFLEYFVIRAMPVKHFSD